MNKILNKVYKYLFYVALGLLVFIGGIVAFGPFKNNSTIVCVIGGILLPLVFFVGSLFKKYFKVAEVLLFVGSITALAVLSSTIATLTQYGFFHTILYRKTPIYYCEGSPYSVVEEALFFYNFKFTEVTINYFSLFAVICGSFLPGIFFVNRKEHKYYFYITLSIGSIGLFSLISLGLYKGIILLVVLSLFAVLYKFYWKNHKVITIVKFVVIGLFALAVIFYIVACINASIGFKFTGFFEKLFVTNSLMKNVSEVLESLSPRSESLGALIGPFGLNINFAVGSKVDEIALLKTGIVEVELLKEVGFIGVTLFFILVSISFMGVKREILVGEETDFEKVLIVMTMGSFFIFESLFFDASPTIYTVSYTPFLRCLPFLVILFVLGMVFFEDKPNKKEGK